VLPGALFGTGPSGGAPYFARSVIEGLARQETAQFYLIIARALESERKDAESAKRLAD
jgi:hypothetical protein